METEEKRTSTIPHKDREKIIVRTSILGIVVNLLLSLFKAIIGILSNSVAITTDALNNLTDALSSIVTIIGVKLAGKKPDKNHPLGYGRIEYLSTLIISAIILGAGVKAILDSVDKIIMPEAADYSTPTLIILAVAVFVKLFLGTYFKVVGKKVNSSSLTASGIDALYDALLTLSVLASALIYMVWEVSLEAYVGILIGAFIIKNGVEILKDTLDDLLGKRSDKDLVEAIKSTICDEPQVLGVYDLLLHSYGPDRLIGSAHVEVPSTITADEIDRLERRICETVQIKHGIILSAVGIYAKHEEDEEIYDKVSDLVFSHPGVLQIHGFSLDRKYNILNMDIVMDIEYDDRETEFERIKEDIAKAYPDYTLRVIMDIDA